MNAANPPAPPVIVLMGVSGSGKTTIGTVLAAMAGLRFADADEYHSPASKQKMAAGVPLSDEDREPWLKQLHAMLADWMRTGQGGVLACSALKASYRTTLAAGLPAGSINFVLLNGSRELIAARLAERRHAYMNPALLDSQLDTLEVPPGGYSIVNDRAPELIAGEILKHLGIEQKGIEQKR